MRLLLAALLLVHGAAMGQTFACQYTEAAGLKWENGRWKSTEFRTAEPFFLKINGSVLDQKVAADVFGSRSPATAALVHCAKNPSRTTHSCMDGFGTFLFFDESTRLGGRALMFGSASTSSAYRDTTSVAHFTCQQM